ncbi:MAG: hypothetical protein K2O29_01495 [Ruminococcus sp.]|nr:hypothetical protein [Ruminococcus sp.]
MNYEIIIYGKHNPYFYFFNERLKEYGIDAEICYVNKCDIIEKLYLKKYCTVVIFHETNEIRTEIVERSLRYFSKVASDKGLFGSLFGNEKGFRPSNHELICYLADNFVNRFDIYNKHKSVKTEGMSRFAIWESYSNNIFLNHHNNYFY